MKFILCLLFLSVFVGCSLAPNRTFIDEMEVDNDSMFTPGEDFRVVAGDSGKQFRSRKEISERTPKLGRELASEKLEVAIEEQLIDLESQQTERQYAHYLKYKEELETDSRRIYFLKMKSMDEREAYLSSLGIYSSPEYTTPEINVAIRSRDVVLGMDKNSVMQAWGRPDRVDVAGNPKYENERWLYSRGGQHKYIFFEQGKVEGWAEAQ